MSEYVLTDEEVMVKKILKKKMLMPDNSVDMDSVVGIMLELMEENNTNKMLKYLKNNPNASRDDIFDYLDKI